MEMMIALMDQMNQTKRPLQITAGLEEYVVRAQRNVLLLSESDEYKREIIDHCFETLCYFAGGLTGIFVNPEKLVIRISFSISSSYNGLFT